MNISTTVFLISGLMSAGSVFAQEADTWGRHVKNPHEVMLSQEPISPDVIFSQVLGHIDEDVLSFYQQHQASQGAA